MINRSFVPSPKKGTKQSPRLFHPRVDNLENLREENSAKRYSRISSKQRNPLSSVDPRDWIGSPRLHQPRPGRRIPLGGRWSSKVLGPSRPRPSVHEQARGRQDVSGRSSTVPGERLEHQYSQATRGTGHRALGPRYLQELEVSPKVGTDRQLHPRRDGTDRHQ